jgi:hypothetical protein
MIALEAVTITVGAVGIALCATPLFAPTRTLDELGRRGWTWFDHADDYGPAELPNEDVDPPIPVRPLRSRMR